MSLLHCPWVSCIDSVVPSRGLNLSGQGQGLGFYLIFGVPVNVTEWAKPKPNTSGSRLKASFKFVGFFSSPS
jgi:hypothetical protein